MWGLHTLLPTSDKQRAFQSYMSNKNTASPKNNLPCRAREIFRADLPLDCERRNYALYIYSRNSRFSKVFLPYRTIEVLFTDIRKVDFFFQKMRTNLHLFA